LHSIGFGAVFGIAPMIGIQLIAFIIIIFSACYMFQAHFFGFSYLEEGGAAGFLFLIYLVLSNGDSMLKMYFFLSLLVIVFRQKENVVEIFRQQSTKREAVVECINMSFKRETKSYSFF